MFGWLIQLYGKPAQHGTQLHIEGVSLVTSETRVGLHDRPHKFADQIPSGCPTNGTYFFLSCFRISSLVSFLGFIM